VSDATFTPPAGSPSPELAGRPAPAAPRPYHFPPFERRALPNGLRLVVAPVHKLPVVSAVAVVDAGAVTDPAGRDGLAMLTARALTEGTASLDAVAFTERVERLGTGVDAGADWDATVVTMTALTERFADAFALFAEVLTQPAFPAREVERLKGERLAELLQLRAEPRGLADETFMQALYAPTSRYARPDGGSETTVAALTRDDVVAYHAARYRPAATTLVLAGDITADDAERLAARALGAWTASFTVAWPLITMIGMSRVASSLRIRSSASSPLICGSFTSRIAMSTGVFGLARMASASSALSAPMTL
jgi:zinc protease